MYSPWIDVGQHPVGVPQVVVLIVLAEGGYPGTEPVAMLEVSALSPAELADVGLVG